MPLSIATRLPLAAGMFAVCAAVAGCRPANVSTGISAKDNDESRPVDRGSLSPERSVRAAVATLPDDAWSGFRGGSRHGVAPPPPGLPAAYSGSVAFEIQWRRPLDGPGNGSPVVWGDRVVTTWEERKEPGTGGLHLVVGCLDREGGRLRWQRDLGPVTGTTHAKNGIASSTPAVDGERIIVAAQGHLWALDWEGNLRWSVEVAPLRHPWGTASSPVIHGDHVIYLAEGESSSLLVCLDVRSGGRRWASARPSRGAWCTPVLIPTSDDGWHIVVNGTGSHDGSSGRLESYRLNDGSLAGWIRGTSDLPCPTAIVGEGWLVSTSGPNGPVLGASLSRFPRAARGNRSSDAVAWRRVQGGPQVPTGLILNGRLYLLSDRGQLTCHDLSDGEPQWQARLEGRTFSASLVALGERILAVSERGNVHLLRDGSSYLSLAHLRLGQRTLATPALAGNDILVRTHDEMWCLQLVADAVVVDGAGARETRPDERPVSYGDSVDGLEEVPDAW